jgi:hypothetical protein
LFSISFPSNVIFLQIDMGQFSTSVLKISM